jgi:hypothetical protein
LAGRPFSNKNGGRKFDCFCITLERELLENYLAVRRLLNQAMEEH